MTGLFWHPLESYWGVGEYLTCYTLILTLLVMFCNQGAGYTGVFCLSKFLEVCTCNFCTFLYAHYASIKRIFFLSFFNENISLVSREYLLSTSSS